MEIKINVSDIKKLSAETIAERYPREAIVSAIYSFGYIPDPSFNEKKLSGSLLNIINNQPVLSITSIANLSPSTIANRYAKEDIRQAIIDAGHDFGVDWNEIQLAEHLKSL